MPNIKADTAAIQAAASKFASQSTQLAELITAVTGDINGLEGLWDGPSHSAFVSLTSQWRNDINNIQQVLDQVAKRVDAAGIGYSDLDDSIARSFR